VSDSNDEPDFDAIRAEYNEERFQQLVAHDTREYFTRLGLYSVERDMILSFYRRWSHSNNHLNFQAIRAEFDTFNAGNNTDNDDNNQVAADGCGDVDDDASMSNSNSQIRGDGDRNTDQHETDSVSIATRTRSTRKRKRR